MANKQLDRPPPQQPPPDPELLERFLSLQEAELATRASELDLRRLEITKGHEFSTEGLNAQITDRQNGRIAKQTSDNYRYIFLGVLITALLAFLVFALYTGNAPIAKEIIQGAVLVAAGYLGGKYHQKSKEEKPKND